MDWVTLNIDETTKTEALNIAGIGAVVRTISVGIPALTFVPNVLAKQAGKFWKLERIAR